jgi:hypothetical protein
VLNGSIQMTQQKSAGGAVPVHPQPLAAAGGSKG